MESKVLEKIFDYLPVIVATCSWYGWMGGRGSPIPRDAIADVRQFFELLQAKITLKDLPELEDVFGNITGGITFLWDTPIDPVDYKFDSLEVTFYGEGLVNYTAKLESIGIETKSGMTLTEGLDSDIIQNIEFFKRKQDEQREIQKSTALKPTSNKRL